MYCHHCGSLIPDNATFCSECGSKISRMDVLKARVGKELSDPKAKIIVAMAVVIVVLLILLLTR